MISDNDDQKTWPGDHLTAPPIVPNSSNNFPILHAWTIQLSDQNLFAGRENIWNWFGFHERTCPTCLWPYTLTSKRGSDEFGALPFAVRCWLGFTLALPHLLFFSSTRPEVFSVVDQFAAGAARLFRHLAAARGFRDFHPAGAISRSAISRRIWESSSASCFFCAPVVCGGSGLAEPFHGEFVRRSSFDLKFQMADCGLGVVVSRPQGHAIRCTLSQLGFQHKRRVPQK